jgi:hypothetical protein
MPRAISSFVLDVRYSITSSRRVSSFVALATSVLHHSFMCSIINCAVAVLDHHFKYRIISFPPVPSSPIYLSLSFILLCFVLCALCFVCRYSPVHHEQFQAPQKRLATRKRSCSTGDVTEVKDYAKQDSKGKYVKCDKDAQTSAAT